MLTSFNSMHYPYLAAWVEKTDDQTAVATPAQLPAGKYFLTVEVAREQSGRSVLRIPFQWGGNEIGGCSASGNSQTELSTLKVTVTR